MLILRQSLNLVLAILWGWWGVYFAESVGVDFQPIVKTFSDLRGIDGLSERLIYAFYGNTLLIAIFDLITSNYSAINATRSLYFFASLLRAYVILRLLGPRIGIFILFAFQGSLDFNQARLSIALSIFIMIIYANKKLYWFIGIALAHLSVLPYLAFQLAGKRLVILGFVILILASNTLLPIYFDRYFIPFDHELPMNIILYSFVTLIASIGLSGTQFQKNSHWYMILFGFLIASMVPSGFSPLYIGRVTEMTAMISLFGLGMHARNNPKIGSAKYYVYASSSMVIGIYQVLILGGNVWRFFQ